MSNGQYTPFSPLRQEVLQRIRKLIGCCPFAHFWRAVVALATLQHLGWKSGEQLYLVLGDTQKQKRAKQMVAVSKIFLHAEKVYAHAVYHVASSQARWERRKE